MNAKASPKAISRRTSYILIRLEFLRHPQVITDYFNRRVFGPPQCVTTASPCSWIDHQVSGLRHATFAIFRLAFASAPQLNCLTLLHIVTRRPVLQKVRGHTWIAPVVLPLLVSIRFQVLFHSPPGVLFNFPSRYYSLSVTRSYLALGDGPPSFTPDFSCPVLLWITLGLISVSVTRLLLCFVQLSSYVHLPISIPHRGPNPRIISDTGLGSCNFARHYFRNRLFTFFSSRYLDVSVPWVPLITLFNSYYDTCSLQQVRFRIRTSAGRSSFAAHRSFSQLVTSFVGA